MLSRGDARAAGRAACCGPRRRTGEPLLAFVVIVIGGIGSIKGAFVGSILVGVTDTLGRVFLPDLLKVFMEPAEATAIGSSIGTMLIYILMAMILIMKPSGLFGKS